MSHDLKSRLTALRGTAAPVADPQTKAQTLAELSERIARISARAQPLREKPRREQDIATALRGAQLAEGVIVIEKLTPLSAQHGRVRLDAIMDAPIGAVSRHQTQSPEGFLFFDTETTGLSGGAGTLAFLLGLARIEGDCVRVRQYLLTAFGGERAMLEDAAAWIRAAHCLVSFNGKSFDVPLLAARYRLAHAGDPFTATPHLDLLHPTRAAFARSWGDCKLQTAEKALFKLFRDDDVPGHLIPQAWTQFLRDGDGAGLAGVLEHNFRDVISLVALLAVVARAFDAPGFENADALGIARAQLKRGGEDAALAHLSESSQTLDEAGQLELARLLRRGGDRQAAAEIWHRLAGEGSARAMEKLAMYHEHGRRDFATALELTRQLLERTRECQGLLARESRLVAKLAREEKK
jgi:uncharacterized protein